MVALGMLHHVIVPGLLCMPVVLGSRCPLCNITHLVRVILMSSVQGDATFLISVIRWVIIYIPWRLTKRHSRQSSIP